MRCPNCGGIGDPTATHCRGCQIALVPAPLDVAPTTRAFPEKTSRGKFYFDELMRGGKAAEPAAPPTPPQEILGDVPPVTEVPVVMPAAAPPSPDPPARSPAVLAAIVFVAAFVVGVVIGASWAGSAPAARTGSASPALPRAR